MTLAKLNCRFEAIVMTDDIKSAGLLLFYVILPWLAWLQKKLGEKAFSRIIVTLGVIILIDIAYNDIAAYMFGMSSAAGIYLDLGWFSDCFLRKF